MGKINLEELANGAIHEKTQIVFQEVFQNMQDPNTPWKNKREVIIKLKFTQNEDRDDATCEISVEKKLAQQKPVVTKFSMGMDLTTGKAEATEYGPGIKGQMSLAEWQKETVVDGQAVDTETGEIKDSKVIAMAR